MSQSSYDVIVIGSGPGGYHAAIRASQLGLKTACVEKDSSLGGTCLNVGCIPSKALLDSSEFYHQAHGQFAKHGVKVGKLELDLNTMMLRKDDVVKKLTGGIGLLFKKNKIDRMIGHARFTGPGKISVKSDSGETEFSATNFIVATGSAPVTLPGLAFDGQRILSSTEALTLPAVPEKLVVIGAGAVGLELGSVWSRLGSQVTVVEFADRIMPVMDQEMTRLLQRALEKQGLNFKLKTSAKAAKIDKNKVKLTLESPNGDETIECDRVLVSIGRRPYTDGLGLDKIGITLDPKGRIPVDGHFATSCKGVYAIGDVIAGPMLAHKAMDEGIAVAENIVGQAGHVNYATIPNVVYTFPELASVGLTEEEAKQKGLEIRIGKCPWMAIGRARAMDATEGQVKIIGDAKTDRILGVHILGARASDIIAEAVVAMECGASVEDLARSNHAHPTMPEAIKEAAMNLAKREIHF